MSLILEALRKSEAERRRAQAPDLFAPAQVAVAPARRLAPAWVLGAGALVLVAALLLARAFWPAPDGRGAAPAPDATDAPASTPPQAAATPVPAKGETPLPPPAPRMLPAPMPAPAAVADATTAPAPVRQTGAADARDAIVASDPAPVADPAPPPPSPTPAAAEPAPAPIDAAAPPTRLSELAADARRQLPPLKLTMHMWNEAADRRFVILDGRRVAEGDHVGAVRVAEIRRDGVILDWNGQRLELPLR